jgi:hypothetical protein
LKTLLQKALLLCVTVAFLFWLYGQFEPQSNVPPPFSTENADLSESTEQVVSGVLEHDLPETSPYLKHLNLNTPGQNNNSFSQALHTCAQQLQFVVSSDESIIQAADFKKQFSQDSRLNILPICINQALWVDPTELACVHNWQDEGRLGCDLQGLGPMLKELDFTHLVIFAEQGKANVHNGIMFLDRGDTYDVFVHELAHFSGFVDEYPLNETLAQGICAGDRAPNIIFEQAKQSPADMSLWLGLQENNKISVSEARTCDNHSAQAYKPTADITFMEFYDLTYIPEVYIAAWLKTLASPQQLTPAYINFAQLYEGQNNLIQSKYWRQRYVDYTNVE